MAEYKEVATGTIGINKYKTNPKQPDFTGSITIKSHKYTISAWKNWDEENRNVFYSYSIQDKISEGPAAVKQRENDFDDDIPF